LLQILNNISVISGCKNINWTSYWLQSVIQYWQPIPWISLWHVDTNGTILWAAFTLVHCFAWFVIYIGTLMMDIAEMLGIKQVSHVRNYTCFETVT